MAHSLWAIIQTPGDDCIIFPGKARDGRGYGAVRFQGKTQKAHRVSFFMANGFWPTECRHACDNPPCVNPNHLLDGSHADNMADAAERKRITGRCSKVTHCPAGHPYNEQNTQHYRGRRLCRICRKATWAKANRKRRGA